METAPVLLTPDVVREHLDLVIGPEDRARHEVWFVLCDDRAQPVVHAAIEDVDADAEASACETAATPFATVLSEAGEGGGLLVAVTRPGAGRIGETDRRWFRAVHSVCRRLGVRVLAVYLVTPRETFPIHLDDAT
jgi:hypothetical protein